ncbi:MupA/Atu3671 family FMN-dependent luciferase-like monooxygenase [Streptomyces sp. NPDC045431]|uniref:MupA/Atu3671 family FMN-dependent luciferase-like monooxygenase n=1 Tax=Streptomyces sp. NPDC045431 TaxID=3155613 RepID=UPI0033FC4CC8
MDLSVMFFGADAPAGGTDAPAGGAEASANGAGTGAGRGRHVGAYDDILAIARAADRLGFHAVWTPERHFQQVGQVFPSPPVLSAALAVATERIGIRAGSVVLPLHHPLRVVEDWAVVDNLSRGRVGLSVATGWHSADFVVSPGAYADRRERMLRDVPLLRRLWAGEAVEFEDGAGEAVAVRPTPAPVQDALPLWLTTSGSPETWETAGRLRAGVLGATVGQSRDELAGKIARYRAAFATAHAAAAAAAPEQDGTGPGGTEQEWARQSRSPHGGSPHDEVRHGGSPHNEVRHGGSPHNGAPHRGFGARGRVTLMAHTFVGEDDAHVRRLVAEPLTAYLRSYVRQTSANRSADRRTAGLTDEQTALMAEFAFRRYLTWGSLLGSAETCRTMLADLRELGVDEVACFIDFGLGRDEVLAGLHRLAELQEEL